jgi:hypothetical protein
LFNRLDPGNFPNHIFRFDDVDEHELSADRFALVNPLVHESDSAHFSYEARIEADLAHRFMIAWSRWESPDHSAGVRCTMTTSRAKHW